MGIYINSTVINERKKEKESEITIKSIGEQLVEEKINNMKKDFLIDQLGQEIINLKLQMLGRI